MNTEKKTLFCQLSETEKAHFLFQFMPGKVEEEPCPEKVEEKKGKGEGRG
ncbi:MAG: hypothetical protein GY757_09955 [bacterium]|nr:hypothetical protein [bacterium]